MEEVVIKARGGARQGAGRKKIDPTLKRVTFSCRLTPDAAQDAAFLRSRKVNVAGIVERAIKAEADRQWMWEFEALNNEPGPKVKK